MSSFIIENQGTTASIFEILTDLYLNTVAFAPCLNDGVVIPLYLLFHDYPETISNLIIEKLKLINDETFYKNHNIPECNIFRNRNHNLEKITQTFNFLLIPLANKMELDETQIEFLESYIKNPEDFEFYESSIKELTLILIKLFQNHELYRPHHST